jgi:hypothetical protein
MKNLLKELSRRGVLRAVGAYIAIVWLLAQGVVDVFPAVGLPDWTVKGFLIISVAGTPLIAVMSWKYDLTRKGLLRDKGAAVAVLRSANSAIGEPTRKSNSETRTARAIVHVSWTDQSGQCCEQEFDTAFIVGRDYKADVRLQDERVSRRHIKVYSSGEDWYVKDLASLNGTFVDGVPIDVRKIERETVVSLDKEGPVVKLAPRLAEPTRLTLNSA